MAPMKQSPLVQGRKSQYKILPCPSLKEKEKEYNLGLMEQQEALV